MRQTYSCTLHDSGLSFFLKSSIVVLEETFQRQFALL